MSYENESHQKMVSGDGEGRASNVIKPEYGTDTHDSPASRGGISEDLGKC